MLRARQDAVNSTLADAGHPQRQLRIAHTFSLGLGFVPRVLAALLEKHPGLRFRCWQGSATDVDRGAAAGRGRRGVHIVVAQRGGLRRGAVVHRVTVACRACRRPTGARDSVSLAQVRDRPFIAMELGSSSRTHMVNACARAGFVPRIAVEGNDLFVVESMVGAGIGVSVVPEGMTDHQHPGVARIRIVRSRTRGADGVAGVSACGRSPREHRATRPDRPRAGSRPARNRCRNCNDSVGERCCSAPASFIVSWSCLLPL